MAELEALIERKAAVHKRELEGPAMICSAIANWAGKSLPQGKIVQPADFLKTESEVGNPSGTPQSDEELLNKVSATFALFGASSGKQPAPEDVDEEGW